ncbi:cysteine-rich DPF motif domain-containing protein 1 [Bactrocera tryoni]|uniref:cysteine-rich DPF motif domain-containing protein 1 n=1 Tax=Bactrocera tryoni TaxID=59916 RepID=UPI001A963B0A|nr:cysteine-rich DPF motif domain-containing protein 1 [Bactrocera tryoni]XP_039965109.1 cysteine-rich DPF motif domain-containing protein 1 [Bactrocera tryoni]
MEDSKISNQSPYNLNRYEDLQLNVKDDEAEISRLEADANVSKSSEKCESQTDERVPKIKFQCTMCDMLEMVNYYGKTPPFVYGLKLLEDSFVLRDPFQSPPIRWKPKAEYFVIIGSRCTVCENVVCKGAECSFYFTCTYCLACAKKHINKFPIESQAKLRKQLEIKIKK